MISETLTVPCPILAGLLHELGPYRGLIALVSGIFSLKKWACKGNIHTVCFACFPCLPSLGPSRSLPGAFPPELSLRDRVYSPEARAGRPGARLKAEDKDTQGSVLGLGMPLGAAQDHGSGLEGQSRSTCDRRWQAEVSTQESWHLVEVMQEDSSKGKNKEKSSHIRNLSTEMEGTVTPSGQQTWDIRRSLAFQCMLCSSQEAS